MKLEILIGILQHFRCVAGIFSFVFGLASIVMIALVIGTKIDAITKESYYGEAGKKGNQEEQKLFKKLATISLSLFTICMFVSAIPSPDDLFKVRLSLIKLELSSPENVKSAQDTIERIAEKLECKYLGCEKSKETK